MDLVVNAGLKILEVEGDFVNLETLAEGIDDEITLAVAGVLLLESLVLAVLGLRLIAMEGAILFYPALRDFVGLLPALAMLSKTAEFLGLAFIFSNIIF